MKQALAGVFGLLLAATVAAAERPDMTRAERDSIDGVFTAIAHKDCALAIKRLNAGLADKHVGIYMLAGAMYEEGLCLKPNWDRAVQMFLQADKRGHHGAWMRLVAGYAYQQRDAASAIWWLSRQGGLGLPRACLLPSGMGDDPEAIVATLRAWPRGQVDQCLYAAGVMAMIAGDLEYPQLPLEFDLNARVAMHFEPATGRIDWKTLEIEELQPMGLIDGDRMRDRSSRKVRASFENHLRELGERALKRYEKPADVPAEWNVDEQFVFRIEYQ